ncbi:uncharacterized protein [Amphiura filiformis]|uniref:uncharacterized protein n=1 Tax=Amphiura filiformis TaxID=82378 RepID=UPI003B21FC7B
MVKPSLTARMQGQQEATKDRGKEIREFTPGDSVMVRSFRGSDKWKPGVVMQRLGPVSYMVRVQGQLRHVHIDHLISGSVHSPNERVDPMDIPVELPIPLVPQPTATAPVPNPLQPPSAPNAPITPPPSRIHQDVLTEKEAEASPSKKKTKQCKAVSKAHKRPRSLFETRIIISCGESDSDFQDDADNDPDWIAETQSNCLSSEGEGERNEATDEHNTSTKDAEKVTQGLKAKKERRGKKKCIKKEVKTSVCKKKRGKCRGWVEQETCDICMRVLTRYAMKKHKELHAENERYETPNGVYKCLNCLKCFDDRRRLGTHRRSFCPLNAAGEKKDGAEDDDTSNDAQQSKSESMFKCDSCSSQFEIFSDLQEHSKRHYKSISKKRWRPSSRSTSVRCPKCSLVFSTFWLLKMHNTVVHINKGLDVYKCEICHQGFGSKSLLGFHTRRYHKPRKARVTYKCHYCHLLYDTWQLRQHHINQNHVEKSVCEYCGKTLKNSCVTYHKKHCQMNPQNKPKSGKQLTAKAAASSKISSKKVGLVTSSKSKQSESVTSLVSSRTPRSEYYVCKKCCFTFESRNNYAMHRKTCKMAAKSETNNNHDAGQESQPERKVYVCEACQEIFSGSVKLCAHEAEHLSLMCLDCNEIIPDKETLEMHVLLECPERYKLFSSKTHREETDANRDAAEIVETTQENEKFSNPVDSSHTTCTDVNFENVNKQMNDEKPNISGVAEGKDVNNKNAYSDDKNNKTHGSEAVAHTCTRCPATFETVEHLRIHKMVHVVHVTVTELEGMGTDIQDNILTNLNDDDSKQVEKSQKICSSCNVEFNSEAALKEHQKCLSLIESKYPHQCPMCPGAWYFRPMMLNACDHLQHKKQFKYLCQFCGMHFVKNKDLMSHIS